MARRPRRRKEKQVIYICTEGKVTEPFYLDKLKKLIPSTAEITLKCKGIGKDPLKVVNKCAEVKKENGNAYSSYVCLVDVDNHESLIKALEKAQRNNISVVVSNLKFEVWLLWHAPEEDEKSLFSAKNSIELDSAVRKLKLMNGKNPADFTLDDVKRACKRAKMQWNNTEYCNAKGKNPSTGMPFLIDLLKLE